jgi:hypothetical protein
MRNLYTKLILLAVLMSQLQMVAFADSVITAKPFPNVMAKISDSPIEIDLLPYFESSGELNFEIALNSFPEVASTLIENNLLKINLLKPGQTKITVKATLNDDWVSTGVYVGVLPEIEGTYIISDFENIQLDDESYWNGSDESGGIEIEALFLPNNYIKDWFFWTGWAVSNTTDNEMEGYLNQYSAITGKDAGSIISTGKNYAVAYDNGAVYFNDPSAHQIQGFAISNSAYAALSMKNGDDYAKKFGGTDGDDEDWFKVTFSGYRNGSKTGTVDFYLADFRFEDNAFDYIIETWQWVDLSILGKIDSLLFNFSSTDANAWGLKTPSYFVADNFYVVPDNAPVVLNPISDITVAMNSNPIQIDLSSVFSDEDDDDSLISISLKENPASDLVETAFDNHILTLTFSENKDGVAAIILQALSNGKTAETTFNVTVRNETSVSESSTAGYRIYPNPADDKIYFDANIRSIEIISITGRMVLFVDDINPGQAVDLKNIPAGIYIVKVDTGSEVLNQKLYKRTR